MDTCWGIILAGGLARRMGGGDKPLSVVGGRPILARVVARLAPQCASLALNANGDPSRFVAFGLPVVADSVAGHPGPLAGVLAGMDDAAQAGAALLLSAPGDTPFLPENLVVRLAQARAESGAQIAVAASGGRAHHTVALWPVALRAELRHALVAEGERRVSGFIARYPNVSVDWPCAPYDPFFNVNRVEDVALAEEIARQDQG